MPLPAIVMALPSFLLGSVPAFSDSILLNPIAEQFTFRKSLKRISVSFFNLPLLTKEDI